MSSNIRGQSIAPFAIKRLSRRQRPAPVEAELRTLSGMGWPSLSSRILEEDKTRQLSKEALVTVIRFCCEEGDRRKADFVFLELIRRVSGAIAHKLVKWNSISGSEIEDTRQSVLLGLHEFIYSLDEREELWECNFKTCFDFRLLNLFGKLSRRQEPTVSMLEEVENTEGEVSSVEPFDPKAESEFQQIEVVEALHHLSSVDPALSKVFYLKYFSDIPEKEIAEIMEVNERTIRNKIAASRRILQQFYRDE